MEQVFLGNRKGVGRTYACMKGKGESIKNGGARGGVAVLDRVGYGRGEGSQVGNRQGRVSIGGEKKGASASRTAG